MADFTVNPHRQQPYPGYRFQLVWEGRVVAGISSVSPLRRDTEVVVHREGADAPRSVRSPGRTTFAPITLERGVTHDPAFEDWADLVHDVAAGGGTTLAGYRRDVLLRLLNEDGQVVLAYVLYRCWPSTYEALPTLDANGDATVAIQRLVLQCEGWERDSAVGEPAERPSRTRRGEGDDGGTG